ncbi:LAMA3 [Branchiostoma lanceolatum]|uniref:LAMA3 protein n=1 Tax=Branchiostoma lanceolatum TaxID=7740 RepID=A0A8J9ZFN8_BRALA|nr:LAMA3 [Branchiostoma lanceolatum]
MTWKVALGVLLLCSFGEALNRGSVFLAETPLGSPGVTLYTARGYCTRTYGAWAETACWQNVRDTWNIGLDLCKYAWLNDGTVSQPIRSARDGCSAVGVSRVYPREQGGTFGVWCYVGRQVACGRVGQFSCGNSLCVPHWARCDGVNNCGDNSDERQCGGVFLYPALKVGPSVNFWNASRTCQAEGARLANWQDLAEQWAKGLDICRHGWLQDATTAHAVHKTRDGCGKIGLHHDGSYEWNQQLDVWCKVLSSSFTCESVSQYTCNNLNCVPKWAMCDGVDNCGDFSDELPDRCAGADGTGILGDEVFGSNPCARANCAPPGQGYCESVGLAQYRCHCLPGFSDVNGDGTVCKAIAPPGSRRQSYVGDSKVVLLSDEQGQATINFLQAADRCLENGMQIAAWEELRDTWLVGLDLCRNGWLLDGTVAHPIHTSRENCEEVGVNHEGSHEYTQEWDVWCRTYDCSSLDQFSCTNGLCVPHWAHCDGVDNCGDNSDEQSCGHVFLYPGNQIASSVTFLDAKARCESIGARIASFEDLSFTWRHGLDICRYGWLEDATVSHPIHTAREGCGDAGINHDGSREYTEGFDVWCEPKSADFSCSKISQFKCDNHLCIPYWLKCDGVNNCGDNSDENCDGEVDGPGEVTITTSNYVFLFEGDVVFDSELDTDLFTFLETTEKCAQYDSTVATWEDLKEAYDAGLDLCVHGWLMDATIAQPIHYSREVCTTEGVDHLGSLEYSSKFHIWCKPDTFVVCEKINQFGCGNKLCVPYWARCDGVNNCGDNSDEENCGHVFLWPGKETDKSGLVRFWDAEKSCQAMGAKLASWEDMYKTFNVGLDICRMAWLSDSTTVHPIHTARGNCGEPGIVHYGNHEYHEVFDVWCEPILPDWSCKKIDQFSCDNGLCVPHWLVCNGINNCGDNSDEKCDNAGLVTFLMPSDMLDQYSLMYSDASVICDGVNADVATVDQLTTAWNTGLDICRKGWIGDGIVAFPLHYPRVSCEEDYGSITILQNFGYQSQYDMYDVYCTFRDSSSTCDDVGQFTCKNKLCVPFKLKCDGINNCGDNSDEENCAPKLVCTDDLAQDGCSILLQLLQALLQDIQAASDKLDGGGGGGTAPEDAVNRLNDLSTQVENLKNQLGDLSTDGIQRLRDAIIEADGDATPIDNKGTFVAGKGSTEKDNADTTNQRATDLDDQIKALNARLDELKERLGTDGTDGGAGPSGGDLTEARSILAEIEGRKTNDVNFEPNKNAADSEKAEVDKLNTDVTDWLKSSGSTGAIVNIEAEIDTLNQNLNDMGEAIDKANEVSDEADRMNKVNDDRLQDTTLQDSAKAAADDMKDTVNTAQTNLDEAKKAFEEGKVNKNNLDGYNEKITEGRNKVKDKVDDLGDLDDLEAKVKEAEDHGVRLQELNKLAQDNLKDSGGDVSQKALQAIAAYESVVTSIDDAEAAARQARKAARDAKKLVVDGNFDATASTIKQKGDDSLKKARDQSTSLKNDLKPRLDAADSATTDVETGLQIGRDQLNALTLELNKLESPDPGIDQTKINKADKRATEAKTSVDDIISGQYGIDQNLDGALKSVQELEDAAASGGGGGGGSLAGIQQDLEGVRANLAKINALKVELEGTMRSENTVVNEVKGSIEAIRRMIREARATANGINHVPMRFGGNTAVRLDTMSQPLTSYFTDNKNAFDMSMAINSAGGDGTVLFIGDPNNANSDYIGLEIVNGRLRASSNLNGGGSAFNFGVENSLTAGQWENVKLERVGNYMKLSVGGNEVGNVANNNYILFDMPENGGVWVGGVEGSNLPSGMSLGGRGFRGHIDDLKFGDDSVPASGLWNFRFAQNLPTDLPIKEMSTLGTISDTMYFDGKGYGNTREQLMVNVRETEQQVLFSAFVRPGGPDGLIFFYSSTDQNLFFAIEVRNNRIAAKIKLPSGTYEGESQNTVSDMLIRTDFIQVNFVINGNRPQCATLLLVNRRDMTCIDSGKISSQVLNMIAQVGGLDETKKADFANMVVTDGYKGCIKQLQVLRENRQIVHMGSLATTGCPILIRRMQFSGVDSYLNAKWPTSATTYPSFEATFTFRTSADNGVMLLAKGDLGVLWTISMSNGKVIFAAFGDNTDAGASRVTSQNVYNDGQEHYILVRRFNQILFLQLDDNIAPNTNTNENFQRGTFTTNELILGGLDPGTNVTPGSQQLVDNTGHFQGCIKKLIFRNGAPEDGLVDFRDSTGSNNVMFDGPACDSG